jgi:hypothetical protein
MHVNLLCVMFARRLLSLKGAAVNLGPRYNTCVSASYDAEHATTRVLALQHQALMLRVQICNAQSAGASAAIIISNEDGPPFIMGGKSQNLNPCE